MSERFRGFLAIQMSEQRQRGFKVHVVARADGDMREHSLFKAP